MPDGGAALFGAPSATAPGTKWGAFDHLKIAASAMAAG